MKNIKEIAKVIRSKNCSPFELTIDIIISSEDAYNKLKNSNAITTDLIAKIYNLNVEKVHKVVWFDPAYAIKVVMDRVVSSGAIGDSDVYGAQQHAPLLDLEFDV